MKNCFRLFFVLLLFWNISLFASTGAEKKIQTIHNVPAALSATISGTATVCQSTQQQITFTGSGGTAPYTFTYKINSGADLTVKTTGTNSSITIAVNTANSGTFTYSLVSVEDSAATPVKTNVTGSAVITIKAGPNADLSSDATTDVFNGFPVFKVCANQATLINFFNASSTTSTNTNYSIDWGDGSPVYNPGNSWSTTNHTYAVGLYTLLYTITGQNNCTITKTYKVFVGNNPAVGLGNPGNTDICISSALTFPITGTENNPPGTTYTVTFNDGSAPINYNHPPPTSVTHQFLKSSCNTTSTSGSTSFQNSFYASITAINPCDQSSASVVPIRISTTPVADFSTPSTPNCTNSSVCITNTSIGGDSATSSSCSNPKLVWTISPGTGFTLSSGTLGNDFGNTNINAWSNGSNSICPVFSVAGTYTITLKIGSRCGVDQITKTICVEQALNPQYTLSANQGCAPLAVTTQNNTVVANLCSAVTYKWQVLYNSGNCGTTSAYTFTNGTTSSSVSPSFNFTEPGTYDITLTALTACGNQTTTQTVTVKKIPTVSIASIADTCGAAGITPNATVNGCAPASSTLTYAWNFPGGTPTTSSSATPGTINYTATGNYTVSLVVSNECGSSTTANKTFAVKAVPSITNTNLNQTICSGSQTTAVALTADQPGTTFSWTASSTNGVSGFAPSGTGTTLSSQTLTAASSAGTVTYVIKPTLNGCDGPTVNYVINVSPAPAITTQPVSSTICKGGSAQTLTVVINSSGTPAYQWFSNTVNSYAGATAIAGETNSALNPPTATVGTVYYYCVISLPSGACTNLNSNIATITVLPQPTVSIQPTASQNLCIGVTIPSPLSVGYADGAGTASYQWYSNTSNTNTGGTAISGATQSGYTPPVYTSAGSYYYYATISLSGNGCNAISSNVAQITVYDDPTVTTQPQAAQTLCQGETPTVLQVVASGGNGNFSYQWYSNNSNNSTTGSAIGGATNASYTPPTNIAGTKYYYCVVSQSTTGCGVTSDVATVTVNVSPTITNQPVAATYCINDNSAALSFSVGSGAGTPTYQWYSNVSNSNTGGTAIALATNATFKPSTSAAGTTYYYCVITFPSLSGGCATITTNAALITVNPKPVIAPENRTICSGGTFTVTPNTTGGNIIPAGTTYTWSNPQINPAGSISGASAQNTPQNSISQTLVNTTSNAATIIYTVTPMAGICAGNSFSVTVTVNPAINANVTLNNSSCYGKNDGSITTSISGGIPFPSGAPYVISWTGPNNFTSTSGNISNLVPGNYNLTVSDAGGCPFSKTYQITEPADIVITTVDKKDITCFGSANGSIKISVTGGTGNYVYTWTKNSNPHAASQNISNLDPGNYSVSVTDTNSCGPKTTSFIITEPPVLAVNLVSQTDVKCYGDSTGAININVSGGTPLAASPGYNFSWTGPNGFTASSQNLNNIKAGNYNLIVTDQNSCSKNLTVTISQSPKINIAYTTTPIVCYGDNNASISVTLSGGVPGYQYQWDNMATTLNQTNLSAGDYTITVTDDLSCQQIQKINIPEAPIFKINPVVSNISCFGNKDGSIALNLVGGIKPVSFKWGDGSTAGLTRNNLAAGVYSFEIIDSKPCKISVSYTIVEPQLLVLSANVDNALDCNDANSGAINLMVSGGWSPFKYDWTNGTQTEDLNNIPAGNYSVVVTDSRGCSKTGLYPVTRPDPIVLDVKKEVTADCETKVINNNFSAQVSGGVSPYVFNWSSGKVSGSNNQDMTTSENGMVLLQAKDALGCVSTVTFDVKNPVLGIPSIDVNSIGYTNYGHYSILDPIQFTTTLAGDYESLIWDFGDGTFSNDLNPQHTYVIPKDYVVTQTITYPYGCVEVKKITLSVDNGYVLVLPTAFTPNGDTMNDTLRPVTKGLTKIRMDVYDTLGSMIYSETGDVIKGWDGKIKGHNAENGNYNCMVSAETFYGTVVTDQKTFVLIK